MPKIKTALISVWDKIGVIDFSKELSNLGIEIFSTGGTAKLLREAGITIQEVSQYTGAAEMLNGRVKTLHPKIHGGLLALRDNPHHMDQIKNEEIKPIDMVVVNLYPFIQVIKNKEILIDKALENIDIGGPSMLRSGAKNFKSVAVVPSPEEYKRVLKELSQNKGWLSEKTCLNLALKAFQITSFYDSAIAKYLQKKCKIKFPSTFTLGFEKSMDLRYGENPHQEAAFYKEPNAPEGTLPQAEKLGGKELSFNNILDFQAALNIVDEMDNPFTVVIKHNNPCGAAETDNLLEACQKAFQGDPLSAFGSIVGLNKVVDAEIANCIASPKNFVEGIIAPDYTKEALQILKEKQPWGKKVIILKTAAYKENNVMDIRKIRGGALIQDEDSEIFNKNKLNFVTKRHPTEKDIKDLKFAWKICKYIKSNAILISKDKMVVGVGAGQMSRIDATLIAIRKSKERCKGAVLASDAFFPFPDVLEEAKKAGITAIIQPGGSIRDKEVIKAADRYNIAMVFTGTRHFLH